MARSRFLVTGAAAIYVFGNRIAAVRHESEFDRNSFGHTDTGRSFPFTVNVTIPRVIPAVSTQSLVINPAATMTTLDGDAQFSLMLISHSP